MSSNTAPARLDPLRLAYCRSQPVKSQFCVYAYIMLYTIHVLNSCNAGDGIFHLAAFLSSLVFIIYYKVCMHKMRA